MKFLKASCLYAFSLFLGFAAKGGSVAAPELPGWLDLPFGKFTFATPGSVDLAAPDDPTPVDGPVWRVVANGENMYSTNLDGGRFVFTGLAGDGEVRARIYLDASPETKEIYSYAGVMLRENLRNDAKTAIFYRRKNVVGSSDGETWIRGQYRTSAGATMSWMNPIVNEAEQWGGVATQPWVWCRLVRQGTKLSMLYSAAEAPSSPADWTFYQTVDVDFPETVNAGFFSTRLPFGQTYTYVTNYFANPAATPFVTVSPASGGAGLAVSWTPVPPTASSTNAPGALTYRVSRAFARDGAYAQLADGLAEPSYVDAAAEPGRTVFYRVEARDGETVHLIGTSAACVLPSATAPAAAELPATGYHYAQWQNAADFLVISNGLYAAPLTVEPNSVSNEVKETYSMLYTASLVPEATDDYWFAVSANGAASLNVDGRALFSEGTTTWANRDQLAYFGPVRLTAGRSVPLRVLFAVYGVMPPYLNLKWARAGAPDFQVVPAAALAPLPGEWTGADFGAPGRLGVGTWDAATGDLVVAAGGSAAEGGHWLAREKGVPAALETSFAVPADGAKAGLMVRADLDAFSAYAACWVRDGGIDLVCRAADGETPVTTPVADVAVAAGDRIRLRATPTATGTSFALRTADGAWTDLGTVAFGARQLRVGPAVSAASADAVATVAFSDTAAVALEHAFLPLADTWISGYTTASSRAELHGTTTSLRLRNHRTDYGVNQVLLKFDTRGLDSVDCAKVRLYCAAHTVATNERVRVTRVLDTAWNDSTTTWESFGATTPLPLAFVATNDVNFVGEFEMPKTTGAAGFVEVDVTKAVRASAREGGLLTLGFNLGFGRADTGLTFASREAAPQPGVPDRRPRLVCSGPGSLGLVAGAGVNAGEITLRWRFAESAANYDVYRGTAEGTGVKVASGIPAWQASWTDTGLAEGATYWYALAPAGGDVTDLAGLPSVSATCAAASRGVLKAVADTYVDGAKAAQGGKNYRGGEIVLKSMFTPDNTQREGFILYNVKDLADAETVMLRVSYTTVQVDPNGFKTRDNVYVQVEARDLGDWSGRQANINWNNSPAGENVPWTFRTRASVAAWPDQSDVVRFKMAGFTPTIQYVDVTDLVRNFARRGGEWLTLNLYRTDENNNNNCQILSSDHGSASTRGPVLLYSRAAGEASSSRTAPVAAPVPGYGRIVAHDDTYIDGNNKAGVLYTVTRFNLKHQNGPTREDYFRFDVSGLDVVEGARVRFCMYPPDTIFQVGGIVAYDLSDQAADWDVKTFCWDNVPFGSDRDRRNTAAALDYEIGRIPLAPWSSAANNDQYFFEFDVGEATRRAARAGHDLVIKLTGDYLVQGVQGKAYFSVCSTKISADDADVRKPALYYVKPDAAHSALCFTSAAADRSGTVSWRPVRDAASYTLLRTDEKAKQTAVVAENVTGTSVPDADLRTDGGMYTYTLVCHYADGTSATGGVKTVAATRASVHCPVVADTFVEQHNPTNNYGTATSLLVKHDVGTMNREAFLRLDLSDLETGWAKAELELTPQEINEGDLVRNYRLGVAAVPDTGWTETGDGALTWANAGLAGPFEDQPDRDGVVVCGFSPLVSTFVVDQPFRIDVSSFLRTAQAQGREQAVLQVYGAGGGGEKRNLRFYSRNITSLDFRPKLVLSYAKVPQPATMLILR